MARKLERIMEKEEEVESDFNNLEDKDLFGNVSKNEEMIDDNEMVNAEAVVNSNTMEVIITVEDNTSKLDD